MTYYHKTGVIVPFIQKFYKQLIVVVAGLFIATTAAMSLSANAASLNGCEFDDSVANLWVLQADCVSTAEIYVPAGTTLDGDGNTIFSSFAKTDNSNNASIGVLSSNVTIQNLTIDGAGGLAWPQGLHGINIYSANDVIIDNVTIKNMTYSGIVVNGSEVDVSDVTTSGNGWSGIGVDLGTGVTGPAVLNIVGPMTQTDMAQIYVDDTTKAIVVNDALSQYTFVNPATSPDRANDRLYSLKEFVTSKEGCKKDGWKLGVVGQSFKNQGQCVAYFASNGQNIR